MRALGGLGHPWPILGLAPAAVAAHRSSPWAWRAGCVSRRPAPGLSGWLLLWSVGVRCGCFLCAVFPVSGGLSRRCRVSSGRALVAGVGRFGVVVWRSALARSGVGAVVFRCGRGGRVPVGLGGGGVRVSLVGLVWVPAGRSSVCGSGLRRFRTGGRPVLAAAGPSYYAACSGRVGASGLVGLAFPLGAAKLPPRRGLGRNQPNAPSPVTRAGTPGRIVCVESRPSSVWRFGIRSRPRPGRLRR